jgi:hypothetical protein
MIKAQQEYLEEFDYIQGRGRHVGGRSGSTASLRSGLSQLVNFLPEEELLGGDGCTRPAIFFGKK